MNCFHDFLFFANDRESKTGDLDFLRTVNRNTVSLTIGIAVSYLKLPRERFFLGGIVACWQLRRVEHLLFLGHGSLGGFEACGFVDLLYRPRFEG